MDRKMGQMSPAVRERDVVIVVDDDPAVRNSLQFSLELEGFSVRIYGHGDELLKSGEAETGSCFVIDQKMPEMTGLELIERLRARHIHAPVILITSQPGARLKDLATRAHVFIIEKPLLTDALIDQVRNACARDGQS
jgi:FixJ family two-component response regulator